MTVEQAVMGVLIANYPTVRNHVVQTAHPTYQMSGLARLRGLKQDGIVSYRFDSRDNTYHIRTPREELVRALAAMERGERDPVKIVAAMRGFKGSPPVQPEPGTVPSPIEREEEKKETPEKMARMLEEMRRFRESLGASGAHYCIWPGVTRRA